MSALGLLLLLGPGAPFVAAPLSDSELGKLRGGFRLPNGLDIALSVQTQTAVDGAVLLRTVFRVEDGAPTVTAFVPRQGVTVAPDPTTTSVVTGSAGPTVTYDNRTGIRVTPPERPEITIGQTSQWAGNDADFERAGPASGVTEASRGNVRTVSLNGGDISITHLAGSAFGSAVANSGSDRTIDTQTAVAITLGNAGPDVLGSAGFRAQDAALDALQLRTR